VTIFLVDYLGDGRWEKARRWSLVRLQRLCPYCSPRSREKRGPYELVPVDIFAADEQSPEYMARHPFGKIPAFEHSW
jgi:glutathione S-transferase